MLSKVMPVWLTILGPIMIAAMPGVSMIPSSLDLISLGAKVFGGATTLLIWRKTRSLGWPVFSGVLAYSLIKLLEF
ncbi:hypothetical protein BGP75_17415 [Motiliproteus sp. MSK22-1]|nr:hypothetical protein BGP75_17415 [Motiliproteus sp. MSK22-1]